VYSGDKGESEVELIQENGMHMRGGVVLKRKTSAEAAEILRLPLHYRPRQCSAVWQNEIPDWAEQLANTAAKAVENHSPCVFFRVDDVGAGGQAFEALCRLFRHHQVPLNMAVVPAWLSNTRIKQLFSATPPEESLWSWHQHGWRHVNWQRTGKKSEFGQERPFEKQWRDIWQGKKKMEDIFGRLNTPVFTPPWNRLSTTTLKILQELDFRGVSLTDPFPRGSKTPTHLKNIRIHLDLHTRKNKDSLTDYQNMLEGLNHILEKKTPSGIMIHHQRMTLSAFEFLHELLTLLSKHPGSRFLKFEDLI
jgi:peptidoglycan/xylan/chitin deacetylase (PgdA/CDA1 family)